MKSIFLSIVTAMVLFCVACNKNGNDMITPSQPSDTTPIAGSKPDVYLAGELVLPAFRSPVGAYWKNDSLVQLTTDPDGYSVANTVTVSGNDLYIGGGNLNRAVYWKNGTLVTLPCNIY